MYPEFAYSGAMQIILAIISFVSAHIFSYLITEFIFLLYDEQITFKQKNLFAFFVGGILNTAWVYFVYFIGGMHNLSPMVYVLVVTPNPLFALLYYILGIKVLKLSPVRSVKLMGHVYLYYIVIKGLNRLLGSIFFTQPSARYNYMLDSINQLTFLLVFLALYFIASRMVCHYEKEIKLRDKLFVNLKLEIAVYVIKATVIYLLMVSIPAVAEKKALANAVILFILSLVMALTILWDTHQATKTDAKNKDAYINVLAHKISTATAEPTAELSGKKNENLALFSILLDKIDAARERAVEIKMAIRGSLENLIMDNVDICVIIDCLLDNALEEAASSQQKWIYFTVEHKTEDDILVIINNSTVAPARASKPGFYKMRRKMDIYNRRLGAVKRILAKYGNCAFQQSYYRCQASSYLEIKKEAAWCGRSGDNVGPV